MTNSMTKLHDQTPIAKSLAVVLTVLFIFLSHEMSGDKCVINTELRTLIAWPRFLFRICFRYMKCDLFAAHFVIELNKKTNREYIVFFSRSVETCNEFYYCAILYHRYLIIQRCSVKLVWLLWVCIMQSINEETNIGIREIKHVCNFKNSLHVLILILTQYTIGFCWYVYFTL